MKYDCNLKKLVGEVGDLIKESRYSNNNCDAILYVCIEKTVQIFSLELGMVHNDFAIMTVNNDCFCFYMLNPFSKPPFNPEDIITLKFIPYDIISKIKIRKFLFWRSLKIYTNNNGKKHNFKLIISEKTIGIDFQKENLLKLLEFIEEKGFKK
jgi:hypothetical protein